MVLGGFSLCLHVLFKKSWYQADQFTEPCFSVVGFGIKFITSAIVHLLVRKMFIPVYYLHMKCVAMLVNSKQMK